MTRSPSVEWVPERRTRRILPSLSAGLVAVAVIAGSTPVVAVRDGAAIRPAPTAPPTPTARPAAATGGQGGGAADSTQPPGGDGPSAQEPLSPIADPDFVVGDWELRAIPWSELRLNGGPILEDATEGPTDDEGLPFRPPFKGAPPAYNPTVLAQQGMKRLDSWRRSGRWVHRQEAERIAGILDDLAQVGRRRRWQPHPYDQGAHRTGWVNANSHGLVLSFFSRLYRLTRDPGWLDRARRLIPSFERRPDHPRWISMVTPEGHLWFEHWPDGPHVHTLNAHLNVLFGLYDYWWVTGSPRAEQYFLAGTATVRQSLRRFRRAGRLSRYSLSQDKGTLHYHHTHIEQLRLLSRMTGDEWFARQADRFEEDERVWHERRVSRQVQRPD